MAVAIPAKATKGSTTRIVPIIPPSGMMAPSAIDIVPAFWVAGSSLKTKLPAPSCAAGTPSTVANTVETPAIRTELRNETDKAERPPSGATNTSL